MITVGIVGTQHHRSGYRKQFSMLTGCNDSRYNSRLHNWPMLSWYTCTCTYSDWVSLVNRSVTLMELIRMDFINFLVSFRFSLNLRLLLFLLISGLLLRTVYKQRYRGSLICSEWNSIMKKKNIKSPKVTQNKSNTSGAAHNLHEHDSYNRSSVSCFIWNKCSDIEPVDVTTKCNKYRPIDASLPTRSAKQKTGSLASLNILYVTVVITDSRSVTYN